MGREERIGEGGTKVGRVVEEGGRRELGGKEMVEREEEVVGRGVRPGVC